MKMFLLYQGLARIATPPLLTRQLCHSQRKQLSSMLADDDFALTQCVIVVERVIGRNSFMLNRETLAALE